MARNPTWERDELILALDLYLRIGKGDDKHPDVIRLSHDLNRLPLNLNRPDPTRFRNANGVAMKLGNFAALDPANEGVALSNGGRRDREVWDEFASDRTRLASEIAGVRARIADAPMRQRQERKFWAFAANPQTYRIEEAVRALPTDNWTTKGKDVQAGDRVIIWKTLGRDGYRGIVALAEVLSDREVGLDDENRYWVDPSSGNESAERVKVRYVLPPNLPLWLSPSPADPLRELSVCRATGGTVFYVSADQWSTVLDTVGGWPQDMPDVVVAREIIAELAGKSTSGQGFKVDPRERQAVEKYAMQLATAHYEAQGWTVKNVSTTESYDLRCTKKGAVELHVEVKGTTSEGTTVLLTPNEVEHARAKYPNVALYVVSDICIITDNDGEVQTQGGLVTHFEPWQIDQSSLKPIGYEYTVPAGDIVHVCPSSEA